MSISKINLVIIGHKDHGKSTLIGRLLWDSNAIPEQKLQEVEDELKKAGDEGFRFAFLLDTLEEERRGGLTIDIMQTPFKTQKRFYTIIDCPGHKEFIKKMLTGASQADAAVLVVSAKEGVGDQTRQHAFLAKTLGLDQMIVAINKMDEVNYDEKKFKEISKELEKVLNILGYENTLMIPISALKGENVFRKSERMPWYKGLSLIDTLDKTIVPSTSPVDKSLRGCVQDSYELEKTKIIVCKIETGVLETGKVVIFNPSGEEGLVKKIEKFGEELQKAEPGDSVGIIAEGTKKIERGEVLSYPENPGKMVKNFAAEIILFSNVGLRKNSVVRIRCGTAEKRCKVQAILEKIDPTTLTLDAESPTALRDGDVGKVLFSPLEPMCVEKYSEFPPLGRFVIEGKKGTVAAGIIFEVE